jgi:hypothetical protein
MEERSAATSNTSGHLARSADVASGDPTISPRNPWSKSSQENKNREVSSAKEEVTMNGHKMKDLVTQNLSATNTMNSTHGVVRETPSWYGALAQYARRAHAGSDMKAIRTSIARGIAAERQL